MCCFAFHSNELQDLLYQRLKRAKVSEDESAELRPRERTWRLVLEFKALNFEEIRRISTEIWSKFDRNSIEIHRRSLISAGGNLSQCFRLLEGGGILAHAAAAASAAPATNPAAPRRKETSFERNSPSKGEIFERFSSDFPPFSSEVFLSFRIFFWGPWAERRRPRCSECERRVALRPRTRRSAERRPRRPRRKKKRLRSSQKSTQIEKKKREKKWRRNEEEMKKKWR